MKKETSKKTLNTKKSAQRAVVKPVAQKSVIKNSDACRQCFNPWSLSIYVYWFIILFFIAATFYILGRSHGILNNKPVTNNVEVTEEALLQANDYLESGKTKLFAGDAAGAIADFTTAIDADNSKADFFILRGEAYMQSGDNQSAMVDFDTALVIDSENAVAYYDRSLLNTRMEDFSAALNDINNALSSIAKNPNVVLQQRDLYAKRGQLNLWLKNWDGAIADYTNSLARPDGVVNPKVYAERAEAYTAVGNYSAAVEDYASAIRVISEQIQALPSVAEREALSSDAMGYFEKSAALNLNIGNIDGARSDLASAYTIASALNDTETMGRLQSLISELQ